jgi:SAM-dependent methyltransferase
MSNDATSGQAPRLDAPANEEDPRPDSPWWGVHAARYRFASRNVEFARLLDIACGSGYGVAMLSAGGWVVGVDVDPGALRSARDAGPVLAADGCRLPFPDAAFDAVVTLETIEHLQDRDAFLSELLRVLAPGGSLVLSTPNALYTRPVDGRPRNPFHVFEYTPEELLAALGRFDDVRLQGQSMNARFTMSPFWDDQRRLPRTPRAQARLFVWRVLDKLPAGPRDRLSGLIWHHRLYPTEDDYVFSEDEEALRTAPVLVVTATAPSRG